MELTCPYCHQICETDINLANGQHIRCPFCGEKFVFRDSPISGSSCPSCGKPTHHGDLYCRSCGASLKNKRTTTVEQPSVDKKKKINWKLIWIIVGLIWLLGTIGSKNKPLNTNTNGTEQERPYFWSAKCPKCGWNNEFIFARNLSKQSEMCVRCGYVIDRPFLCLPH